MCGRRIRIAAKVATFCLLAWVSAFGAGGDKTQTKGVIISRTGEALILSSSNGTVTVILTDNTKTKDNKGLLGLRKEYMANTVLIPGLKVEVDGVSDDQGRLLAKTITVDGDDLETAEMIQSGLHPTAGQVAANTQDIQELTDRFSQLSDYDVKAESTVKFAVGSSQISTADLEQLKKLAQTAIAFTGYIIEVKGFADATGNATMNEKLSRDRAEAVVGYLIQQCNVPVRHIVAPGAMGEYQPAASNETKEGRAENRRVEIKVLVNKGIAGS
jgi:outer membrane protein OmpA-like peptidoglycan-associated protein